MSVETQLVTAADLLRMPRGVWRYELVRGELRRMSPAGHAHGRIAARFLLRLGLHVERQRLGAVYAAETGFVLQTAPDTVRAPDVAFVTAARLRSTPLSPEGFFPGAPDLAVEVVSPSDSYSDVHAKVIEWLDGGCRVVVVADPKKQSAAVYRSLTSVVLLSGEQALVIEDLLPGWSVQVSDLFRSDDAV